MGENYLLVKDKSKPKIVKKNTCHHCHKDFTRKYNLKIHTKKYHTFQGDDKSFDTSNKVFFGQNFVSFDIDQDTHLEPAQITPKFNAQSMTNANTPSHKCDICKNFFSDSSNLAKHKKNRHGKNENFPCDVRNEYLLSKHNFQIVRMFQEEQLIEEQ